MASVNKLTKILVSTSSPDQRHHAVAVDLLGAEAQHQRPLGDGHVVVPVRAGGGALAVTGLEPLTAEPEPLRERMQLGLRVRGQVAPAATTPRDEDVIDVDGHCSSSAAHQALHRSPTCCDVRSSSVITMP